MDYTVTNLLNEGEGSFRYGLQLGAAQISFDVAGTIELESALTITSTTIIDGTTAPNGGVCLKNYGMQVDAPNCVISNLRIRPGAGSGQAVDTLFLTANADNCVIDHCSLSWSVDEILEILGHNVEIRYCVISESLRDSVHPKGGHSKALWVTYGGNNVLMHHNLVAHSVDRNPLITCGDNEFCNNVLYNVSRPIDIDAINGLVRLNCIGNVMVDGADTWPGKDSSYRYMMRVTQGATYIVGTQIYVNGNICGTRPTDNLDQDLIVDPDERGQLMLNRISLWNQYSAEDVSTVLDTVLATVGALPRDSVDARIVADVQNQTGTIIDDPSDVGGWPDLTA